MATDQYEILKTASFSWGIMQIFTAWVALISITIGKYRNAMEQSDVWSQTTDAELLEARNAIWRAAAEAIFIFMTLMVAMAILIPLLTKPLDERMGYIISGVSRFISAVILGMLSLRVAFWVGIYRAPAFWWSGEEFRTKRLGSTLVELKHRVRWAISKQILRSFFILLVLFCGADAVTIPVSILAGLALGVCIDWGIYSNRRIASNMRRQCFSISFVVLLIAVSTVQFSFGLVFIAAIWQEGIEDVADVTWDYWGFAVWLVLLGIIHVVLWWIGNKEELEEEQTKTLNRRPESTARKARPRMATSMIFSDWNVAKCLEEEETAKPSPVNVLEGIGEEEEDESNGENAQDVVEVAVPRKSVRKSTTTTTTTARLVDSKIVTTTKTAVEDGEPRQAEKTGDSLAPEAGVEVEACDDGEIPEAPSSPSANEKVSEETIADKEVPTLWELMMDWQCCGCTRGDDIGTVQKVSNVLIWIIYFCVCAFSVFVVIMNIISTQQQKHAASKLPAVYDKIYRYMDEGPVCAFDDRGADSNITTFPDTDAAHDAGFFIVHCGACSHCSDWHNLRLEYTTRNSLAAEGKECAMQKLFGGSYEGMIECLEEEPPIGFQGGCAVCWADDILCTISHCWAIGVQSFFINTLGNFEVKNGTITSAACEEAHCEAGNPGTFVACSGATRRRMNVTSDIERPGSMRCGNVDVDWAELFPGE